MKIALAADHGGFARKEELKAYLLEKGHEVEDFGTHSTESCHYPAFGEAAANAVAQGDCQRGVVVCTTGIGMSIVCNKVHGVRCALCIDEHAAEMTRRHNNANMLALGAAYCNGDLACRMLQVFLDTPFDGGRHETRVEMIRDIEKRN